MSDITQYQTDGLQPIDPASKGLNLSTRLATQDDFAFIDALQKSENDKLGFMPESAIRKRIEQGNVIVAEATKGLRGEGAEGRSVGGGAEGSRGQGAECAEEGAKGSGAEGPSGEPSDDSVLHSTPGPLDPSATPRFAGYCLGVDRYQKRSELGIIYQMAVVPEFRRCNVAGALLQAQFDKSAYGTKLYCCWCKQSLQANRFWESMGFVPLAFRAGARARSKKEAENPTVHVFWQKPVRAEDIEAARRGNFRGWWYPYETQGGAMMEGRVVLPLPPEVSWDEAVPVVLPGAERREAEQMLLSAKVEEIAEQEKAVRKKGRQGKQGRNAKTPSTGKGKDAKKKQGNATGGGGGAGGRAVISYGFGVGSGFGKAIEESAAPVEPTPSVDEQALERLKAEKDAAKQALKAAQRKNDPELVAYARELRDRWQEQVSPGSAFAGMIEARQRGKYAASRLLAPGSDPGSGPGRSGDAEGRLGSDLHTDTKRVVKRLDAA